MGERLILGGALPQQCGRILLGSVPISIVPNHSLEVAMLSYLASNRRLVGLVGNRFYPHQIPAVQQAILPAITYYRSSTDHEHGLQGSAGRATTEIAFDIWSTRFLDLPPIAEALRQALQGSQGCWGSYGIYRVLLLSEADDIERPADGSTTWYYSRSLDFEVTFQESIPDPSLPDSIFAGDTKI